MPLLARSHLFSNEKGMEQSKDPTCAPMKVVFRIWWHHNAIVDIVKVKNLRPKVQSIWPHGGGYSFHLVRIKIGNYYILRIRSTEDHAARLGLPIV